MYRISLVEDWSFFVGKQLTQLCIGLYDVQLRFGDAVTISIHGDDPPAKSFCHKTASAQSSPVGKMPEMATSLVSLLGACVANVSVENSTTLAICFSNREELRIYDCSDSYESFTVDGPNGLIVV